MQRAIVSMVLVVATSVFGGCLVVAQQPQWKPSPHVAPTDPKKPEEQRKLFQLPPGFEIQLVAAEPHIMNPMNIAFDAKGRLWVTMSSEYPFPAKDAKTKDTVKILEDFGPDGRARKVTTFAENLNIPIGVLPFDKGAIVFSIPNVWYLEDADGDGKADKKRLLLQEYGQRDTHGLTGEFRLGFDGWVYACHGFSNTSTVKGLDGSSITMHSGNTYRFKPDGTRVNYHTHGQVNPFGLAFDPLGNLFSADCHTRPIYQLLRGAHYPSFGKPHDGLGFGPDMMQHNHGSTAIAGITYYAANHFPKEYRDNIFIGNVVTNCINRDSLKQVGSTYNAVARPDLVSCKDRWFRPVDIKLGPDGALYVADFYNRIIGHYEVPLTHPGRDRTHGRIWRIVYKGKAPHAELKAPRKDWTKASVPELLEDLTHHNLTVRLVATHQLVARGKDVVPAVERALKKTQSESQHAHCLWVLHRLGSLSDRAVTRAAGHKSPIVRVHANRILADRKELPGELRTLAVQGLQGSNSFVQRTASEVLGAHPAPENVKILLALRHKVPARDTHLRHVVRMSLRDQFRVPQTWHWAKKQQLEDKDIREIASVILSLKNEEAAEFLVSNLPHLVKDRARLREYVRHVARHGDLSLAKKVIGFARKEFAKDYPGQVLVLRAFRQGTQERGQHLSKEATQWGTKLCETLVNLKRDPEATLGIDLSGELRVRTVEKTLVEIVQSSERGVERRGKAAVALVRINGEEYAPRLSKMVLDGRQSVALRQRLADALILANTPVARSALVASLKSAPASLQRHIANGLAGSRQGADALLKAITEGKASRRLLANRGLIRQLARANPPNAQKRLARLTKGLPKANTQILELLQERVTSFRNAKTQVALGVKVFEKNCMACHQLNNKGGKIAPQLDGIGMRGVERLIEDILDPSRNVDQEFRSTLLLLKNGKIQQGLLLRKEGEILVLADAKGQEVRIPKREVAQQKVVATSPMPDDFHEKLREPEFHNLIAFLLEQRQKPTPSAKKD